jgi:hypothetical protein
LQSVQTLRVCQKQQQQTARGHVREAVPHIEKEKKKKEVFPSLRLASLSHGKAANQVL